MNYTDWEKAVPTLITDDVLWTVEAYRLALFLSDICWLDCKKLRTDHTMRSLSDQLYRAVGSISANLAEGYSKQSKKDKARFYEYALGSARESRDWYYKGRHVLSEPVATHRMELTTQIIRLLTVMVPDQRGYKIKEKEEAYNAQEYSTQTIPFNEVISD